ncbi:pyruvate formate lyase family protein [Chloroflexota bacterium]
MTTTRIKEIEANHVPKYFSGDHFIKPVYLSILRTRIYTQVWKETEGEPVGIRRAKAFARYLEEMPIFISPHSLLAGFYAEDPHAFEFCVEVADLKIVDQYIKAGYIREEDISEWQEYAEYWRNRNLDTMINSSLTEEEQRISAPNQRYMEVRPSHHTSRTVPDNDLYLETGLNDTLGLVRQKLERLYKEKEECTDGPTGIEICLKINDLKAMLIAGEAFLRWVNRYSQLAKKMAEEETDPVRKEELLQLSEICRWVPANPPRNLWEAVQSHWITLIGYHMIEHACHGTSYRLDQIFWPFYEKDVLIDKTLPREKALEIMENYLITVDELGQPLGVEFRRLNQGVNYLATYTLGGVKPKDGSDACNELTILILDAIDELRLSHPDFKFRWHGKVNPKVWRRVVEVVRSGLGHPSIKNDNTIIAGLMNHYGFTLEEARSWTSVGCISPGVTTYWGTAKRDAFTLCPAKYLELALDNGRDKVFKQQVSPKTGDATKFTTFEEVFDAYRKQMAWAIRKAMHIKNIGEYWNKALLKRPFTSLFFHRALDAERDVMDAPNKGMPWVNVPGMVDAVDSLISLKKLAFVDKKYTMEEILKALEANWEGYEEMRQEFINTTKFGNDDDFADEVARQTYAMIAEEFSKVTDLDGASPMPSGLVVTWMFLLAPYIGALPNGRKLSDPLADGGCSPHAQFDRRGPMAAVLSTSKIDSEKWKAAIFNQKLTPSSIAGEAGLRKFQSYIETALSLGLDMIQFNVVDSKVLKEAQKHPEQYQNLVVRVSGFNAHFVDLAKFVQDSIIERTEHSLT